MTAQHQPQAVNEDILFVAEHAGARRLQGSSDAQAVGIAGDKAAEAMFVLLSRLGRSFDHQRDRERAELLASVRRS
jgi:hypothetical protein